MRAPQSPARLGVKKPHAQECVGFTDRKNNPRMGVRGFGKSEERAGQGPALNEIPGDGGRAGRESKQWLVDPR